MAFSIFLRRTKNEKNVLNKQFEENIVAEVQVNLKNETSVTDPVFLINGNIDNLTQFNYIDCTFFKRKYFITKITQIRHNLYEIQAHVDVLATYEIELFNTECIFKRRTDKFDPWLNDTEMQVESYNQIQYVPFDFTFQPEKTMLLNVIGGN